MSSVGADVEAGNLVSFTFAIKSSGGQQGAFNLLHIGGPGFCHVLTEQALS